MPTEAKPQLHHPPPLMPGDTIGIVAPAGAVDREALLGGCGQLKALGYKPVYLDSVFDRDQYFAGSVDRRVNELHEMFRRKDVQAIVAARGGYGCNYLLPFLDLALIRENFKALVGYSDVTTLLTWFGDNGLQSFHGPMVAKDFANREGIDVGAWRNVMRGGDHRIDVAASVATPVISKGQAEGLLYGGCLSMLVESLGTPYEIRPDGCILYIEDIGVWPFQFDRMLMQLKLAGKLEKVKAIVFGELSTCRQEELPDYTVESIARRVLGDLGVPMVMGVRSGHVTRDHITLPMGGPARLNATDAGFTLDIIGWNKE